MPNHRHAWRGRRGAILAACAAVLPALPVEAASPPAPACSVVVPSPSFARDKVLFCAAVVDGTGWLYRSANGGRTWTRGARLGAGHVGGLVLAPGYPANRSVYVGSESGTWASHDDGRTAANIATEGGFSERMIVPFRSGFTTPAGRVGPSHEVAIANGSIVDAFVYDPTTDVTRTVLGGPMQNWTFVFPPDYATTRKAVALSNDIGSHLEGHTLNQEGMYAYECTGDLHCTKRLDHLDADFFAQDARTLGGAAHYVSGFNLAGRVKAFRSPDYGRSWDRWTSVENVANKAYGGAQVYLQMTITASHDAPRRLWLSLGISAKSEPNTSQPAYQLWRSDDGGATWQRTGVAWGTAQRGRGRDTLPWNTVSDTHVGFDAFITTAPGNVLLATGAHRGRKGVDYQGLYCSRDLGRTWRRSCF